MPLFLRAASLCLLLLVCRPRVFATEEPESHDLLVVSGGVSGLFDSERNPALNLEYRFAQNWKGFHPWIGGGWATDGAVFAGGGFVYSVATRSEMWVAAVGCGPGYYERHEGADLGSHLEFCSFAEVSYRLPREGHRVVFRLLHISNGGVKERNPGAELLMLGYAMPLP